MKNKNPIDSFDDFFDDDPTDELPVLNEAALARIESIADRTLCDPGEDTGEHAQLNLERVTAPSPDWIMEGDYPAPIGLEDELKCLQEHWQAIEDELRVRDREVATLEESLQARASVIEALETELQAANQSRREFEETSEAMREARAEQLARLEDQELELAARARQLESLQTELEHANEKISELDAERARQEARAIRAEAETGRLMSLERQLLAGKTRIQDLENYLAGRRERWRAMQATCQQQTRMLASLERSTRIKERQLLRQEQRARRLADQLRAQERQAIRYRQQSKAAQEDNACLRRAVQGRDDQLSALGDVLNHTPDDGESLTADRVSQTARVDDLQQQLASMVGNLKTTRRSLADARTETLARDEIIDEERTRAAELAEQLAALQEELKTARQELADKNGALEGLNASAADFGAALKTAENECTELRADRDRLAKELDARNGETEQLLEQLTELQAQRAASDAEITRRQAAIDKLETEIREQALSLKDMGRNRDRIRDLEARIRGLDRMMTRSLHPGSEADDGEEITRVIVAIGDDRAVKYPLYKPTMTIGRSADSDIQIRRQYISRHHAKLCTEHGDTYIEDLGSKNGVLVNAAPVTRQRLRHGDLVDLGKLQFRFIDLLSHDASEGSA